VWTFFVFDAFAKHIEDFLMVKRGRSALLLKTGTGLENYTSDAAMKRSEKHPTQLLIKRNLKPIF
jgi:hypothetical protein